MNCPEDEPKLNCRDVAMILGMSLVSSRRYRLKFLGFSEENVHSGIDRLISEEECFKVFMGVKLIQDARFTLKKALFIVEMQSPWLRLCRPGKLEFEFGLAEISFNVEKAVEVFKNKISELPENK